MSDSEGFLNISGYFGGVYRAVYLSGDALGNCSVMVPAVTGQVPIPAHSSSFTGANPGDAGWVMFEGGDPSLPVWIGTMDIDAAHWGKWGVWQKLPDIIVAQTNVSTTVDVIGGAYNFTAVANRWYKFVFDVPNVTKTIASGSMFVSLCDAANNVIKAFSVSHSTADTHIMHCEWVTLLPAGVCTYKWRVGATNATALNVGQFNPLQIWVEDDGPLFQGAIMAGPPVITAPSNTAFGVIDWHKGGYVGAVTPVFSSGTMANTLLLYTFQNATLQAGRRYALRFSARAVSVGAYFQLFKDGVYYADCYIPPGSPTWASINYTWELNGSEHPGNHTWQIGATSSTAGTGTLYNDTDSASLCDIGPSAGPLTTVAAPTVVAGGWVNFSPSLIWGSTGTQPSLGNGTKEAMFKVDQYGECIYEGAIYFGSTTTAGTGNYNINLPFAAYQSGISGTNTPWIGSSKFFNSASGIDYPGVMQVFGGSNVNFPTTGPGIGVQNWSATFPVAPANGANMCWSIKYRIIGS